MNPFLPVINSYLPEPQASLLSGILFGTKVSMPRYFYDALVTTGTLHIIALSGMNISILVNLVARSTLFLGRRLSVLLTMCLIVLFVLFVGPTPSVVRAAIMGLLSLIAVYFGRQSHALLSLLLAGGCMLLFDFSLAKNLSFQLSFFATLGIILANKKKPSTKLRAGKFQEKSGPVNQIIDTVKENLRLTLSAQIFTVPIIWYTFHRVSLISPVANLLIEWTVQPIMVGGFIASVLGFVWYPLGLLPAWLVWLPLSYFIWIIELLARVPGASIKF